MPETFNFPYHRVQIEHPDNSPRVRFGKGYQFASKPNGPSQLTLRLSFKTMFYYQNSSGGFVSSINPTLNMLALEEFYKAHQLYEKFNYLHPTEGTLLCQFDKPLVTPKGIDGEAVVMTDGSRQHALESFELTLISQP